MNSVLRLERFRDGMLTDALNAALGEPGINGGRLAVVVVQLLFAECAGLRIPKPRRDRDARIAELRAKGVTTENIAKRFGISGRTVQRALVRELQRRRKSSQAAA